MVLWPMADSAAERKRRSRAHKSGDHSLCRPQHCPAAPQPPEPPEPTRGEALYERLCAGLGPAQDALLVEACRIVDRLDRLDAALEDREGRWLTLQVAEDVTQVTVVVDRALAEARQQAGTLKQLVAELRQAGKRQQRNSADGNAGGERKAAGLGDLTARIAARRGTSAG